MTEYCVFVMFEGKSLVYIKPGTFVPKMQYVQQVSFFTGNVEERNSNLQLLQLTPPANEECCESSYEEAHAIPGSERDYST